MKWKLLFGVILGLYWDSENEMETTIWGYIGVILG